MRRQSCCYAVAARPRRRDRYCRFAVIDVAAFARRRRHNAAPRAADAHSDDARGARFDGVSPDFAMPRVTTRYYTRRFAASCMFRRCRRHAAADAATRHFRFDARCLPRARQRDAPALRRRCHAQRVDERAAAAAAPCHDAFLMPMIAMPPRRRSRAADAFAMPTFVLPAECAFTFCCPPCRRFRRLFIFAYSPPRPSSMLFFRCRRHFGAAAALLPPKMPFTPNAAFYGAAAAAGFSPRSCRLPRRCHAALSMRRASFAPYADDVSAPLPTTGHAAALSPCSCQFCRHAAMSDYAALMPRRRRISPVCRAPSASPRVFLMRVSLSRYAARLFVAAVYAMLRAPPRAAPLLPFCCRSFPFCRLTLFTRAAQRAAACDVFSRPDFVFQVCRSPCDFAYAQPPR